MKKLLIKNGTVVFSGKIEKTDILVEDGFIKKIGANLKAEGAEIIDAAGKHIFHGLIDIHTHLREPGFEYKEDIESGSKAAVKGGFTEICCMPNTHPVCDNATVAKYIGYRAKEVGLCKVHPIGAITVGENGETLAEIGKMKQAGIVAVSDDGKPVENAKMMSNAIEYANGFDLVCMSHCEDKKLTDEGVVNEGINSTLTGLKGIPKTSEEVIVAREILLAESLNKPIHICHISTKGSVQLVKEAKARGVKVTAESCPHYFSATDDMILNFDTNTKVNPPLRERNDMEAIREGYKAGIIDVIVTDHAPHHNDEKNIEYNLASFGISGLETSFALTVTNLYKTGILGLTDIARVMCEKPAEILKLGDGKIKEGGAADLMIADLDKKYKIDVKAFLSKGKNSPFDGKEVYGEVYATIVDGDIKYIGGKVK